jgi:hypothetical protein
MAALQMKKVLTQQKENIVHLEGEQSKLSSELQKSRNDLVGSKTSTLLLTTPIYYVMASSIPNVHSYGLKNKYLWYRFPKTSRVLISLYPISSR